MNFHSIVLEHATSGLQKLNGEILSVCLPSGILGVVEKKFAIQRKNTLTDSKSQFKRHKLTKPPIRSTKVRIGQISDGLRGNL